MIFGRVFMLAFAAALLVSATVVFAQEQPKPLDFTPQTRLEGLLKQAAENRENQAAFLRELLSAEICVPTTSSSSPGDQTFVSRQTPQGWEVPLFTSANRLEAVFGRQAPRVCDVGSVLLSRMRGGGAVLNPNFSYGFVWTPSELSHFLGEARVEGTPPRASVSAAAAPPASLVARLTDVLSSLSGVRSATISPVTWPSGDTAWLLSVKGRIEDRAVYDALRSAVIGVDTGGRPVDIVINQRVPTARDEIQLVKR